MEFYIGEIRMFAGDYAPQDWAICDGRLLPINGYEALFSLLGTQYGGDGQTTFALPDLRGRLPIHTSNTIPMASSGGSENVTLLSNELPQHTHLMTATTEAADVKSPENAMWATSTRNTFVNTTPPPALVAMAPATSAAGGGGAHDNVMPSVAINFIIALTGFYPSTN